MDKDLLKSFAKSSGVDDVLSASDFANPAWLVHAAEITQLVLRDSAPPTSTEG
jgi:hypothetical protein